MSGMWLPKQFYCITGGQSFGQSEALSGADTLTLFMAYTGTAPYL